jgi:hypothetical protein
MLTPYMFPMLTTFNSVHFKYKSIMIQFEFSVCSFNLDKRLCLIKGVRVSVTVFNNKILLPQVIINPQLPEFQSSSSYLFQIT